jgi:hypothetical protein
MSCASRVGGFPGFYFFIPSAIKSNQNPPCGTFCQLCYAMNVPGPLQAGPRDPFCSCFVYGVPGSFA